VANCVILDGQGRVDQVIEFTGQSGCALVTLNPQELADINAAVNSLPSLQDIAGLYAPIDPAQFIALASQAGGFIVLAFVTAYFVGLLVNQVR